jgi:hypothetical protein
VTALPQKDSKMTQAQIDAEVVKGWRDSAIAAREDTMVPFYDRLLAALSHRCKLPASISEALNSGDGVYRP